MEKEKFVLIGDSLVTDFDWQARMPFFEVENLGLQGESVQELLKRIPAIIEKIGTPRIILVMTGTNNVANGDFSFFETYDEIIVELSNAFHETEIIVTSLFPITIPSVSAKELERVNKDIEELTKKTGSCFLNMYDRFASLTTEVFLEDGVHITEKAYDIWARSIMECLAFLLEDD